MTTARLSWPRANWKVFVVNCNGTIALSRSVCGLYWHVDWTRIVLFTVNLLCCSRFKQIYLYWLGHLPLKASYDISGITYLHARFFCDHEAQSGITENSLTRVLYNEIIISVDVSVKSHFIIPSILLAFFTASLHDLSWINFRHGVRKSMVDSLRC